MDQVLRKDGGVAALALIGVCSPSASNLKGALLVIHHVTLSKGTYHENVTVTVHNHVYGLSR